MPSFYVTSRNALLRLRRDMWGLPDKEPAAPEIQATTISPPVMKHRCRDDDAAGMARRAKETMERHHLI